MLAAADNPGFLPSLSPSRAVTNPASICAPNTSWGAKLEILLQRIVRSDEEGEKKNRKQNTKPPKQKLDTGGQMQTEQEVLAWG